MSFYYLSPLSLQEILLSQGGTPKPGKRPGIAVDMLFNYHEIRSGDVLVELLFLSFLHVY